MRYYLIAGEASGDLHASNLMRELKRIDPQADFRCWGGDLMVQAGGALVRHYRDLAFMGFAEVVSHLPEILKNFRQCESDLLTYHPDVLILVDYPGFNLRMARFAKKQGLRVFYYISPQLWAWRASRVKAIRRYVDRMFVILPFEQAFYAGYHIRVDFQGHPLMDALAEIARGQSYDEFLRLHGLPDKPIVALLPGSRRMEIGKILRTMVTMEPLFPEYQFVVAGAPSLDAEDYSGLTKGTNVRVLSLKTYELLSHASVALVASGTATLETALIGVPQVVCYRGNFLSYLIAKQLVKVRFISLVNLICEKRVVPELIQMEFNTRNLSEHLLAIVTSTAIRKEMLEGYEELKRRLGGPGASRRNAELMVRYLSGKEI